MNELKLSEQQSTELVERLKRGEKPLVWLRNGKVERITNYRPGALYIFESEGHSWTKFGQLTIGCKTKELDIVALVDESELAKLLERDVERAKQPEWKDGVYLNKYEPKDFATIQKQDNMWRFTKLNGEYDLRNSLIFDAYKYVAPLPPEGYELKILHKSERFDYPTWYFTTPDTTCWNERSGACIASGIENNKLYAFPKQIKQPTAADACGVEIVNVEVQS